MGVIYRSTIGLLTVLVVVTVVIIGVRKPETPEEAIAAIEVERSPEEQDARHPLSGVRRFMRGIFGGGEQVPEPDLGRVDWEAITKADLEQREHRARASLEDMRLAIAGALADAEEQIIASRVRNMLQEMRGFTVERDAEGRTLISVADRKFEVSDGDLQRLRILTNELVRLVHTGDIPDKADLKRLVPDTADNDALLHMAGTAFVNAVAAVGGDAPPLSCQPGKGRQPETGAEGIALLFICPDVN